MPFKKVGDDDYTGPSGRHFNLKQVRLYYARGEHFAAGGSVGATMAKSSMSKSCNYAQGGAVIGKVSQFMKTPDDFRERGPRTNDEVYGKGGGGQASGNPNPKVKLPKGK